jgi:small subunit ribosomal protein S1
VVVLDFDENKKRISLGLKQLQPHPWEVLDEEIKEGSVVKGKIVNIEDYGAFLEDHAGRRRFDSRFRGQAGATSRSMHANTSPWAGTRSQDRDDRSRRPQDVSVDQATCKDPWSEIESRFPEGSRHTGEVKNLTPYGVFVELEEGIGGMVHISDLSWTKRYSHPSEFTKVGEDIEVVILDIDKDSRKLSLGHKQIEENPWDTFEKVFPEGSYHEATLLRKDDRGAIVQLPYGLEAFAPIKHIRKEDGTMAELEDVLTVKVIEFNRDDKRILVSHLRYLEDIRREADEEVKTERRKERDETRRAVKKTQSNIEKSTIGDLDAFSQLKEQLSDEDVEEDKGDE